MEIHELNTEQMGATAYAALDSGSDVYKVDLADLLKSKGSASVPVYSDADGKLTPCGTLSGGAFNCADISALYSALGIPAANTIFCIREVDFTDMDNVSKPGIYYVNSTAAANMANLPVAGNPGTFICFLATTNYGWGIWHNNSTTNTTIYLRVKNTTWGNWIAK